jgi:hypothetical protein
MAVNFKKLKQVAEKAKETHLIDLGKFVDKKLDEVIVPIRVKSIEECINFKNEFKLKKEKVSIEYKPFTRMPKAFRQMYMESEDYRKGQTENTYFQVCKLSEDETKIERRKYRERLFNILIHFDMDYKTEEGKTLWEDAELKPNDYDGLVDIFSDIIKYEVHLDILDLVIDQLKNGVHDENTISAVVFNYGIRKTIDAIEDEGEKKEFIYNYTKMIEDAQKRLGEKLEEAEQSEDVTE